MNRRRAEGPRRTQDPRAADRVRGRDRRRDGQRHVRPDRHDPKGVRRHLHLVVSADRCGHRGQGDRQGLPKRGRNGSRVAARAGPRAPPGRRGRRHDRADPIPKPRSMAATARPSAPEGAPRSRSVATRRSRSSARSSSRPASGRKGSGRSRSTPDGGRPELQGRRHRRRFHAGSQAPLPVDRHRHVRDVDSLGTATMAIWDIRPPRRCCKSKAVSTASQSLPRKGRQRMSSSAPSSRWSPRASRSRTPSSRPRPTPTRPTSSSTPSDTSCSASAGSRCSWERS